MEQRHSESADGNEAVANTEPAVELRDLDDVEIRELPAEIEVTELQVTELEPAVELRDLDDVEIRELPAHVEVTELQVTELEPADATAVEDAAETATDGTQLDVLDVEPTGDPRVDGALDRLRDLAGLPVSEHVDVYTDVHRRLHDALADLDPQG